jgi:hypothetical protein
VPEDSRLANGLPFSPISAVDTPRRIENTISCSMLLLDSTDAKSDTVRVETRLLKKEGLAVVSVVLDISDLKVDISSPLVGLNINEPTKPIIADSKAVATKTPSALPIIFPRRFISFMLAIEEDTLKKTRGTITVNIMFTNNVPRGSTTDALGPMMAPAIPPTMTEPRSSIEDL